MCGDLVQDSSEAHSLLHHTRKRKALTCVTCGYQDVFYSSFVTHLRSHGIERSIDDNCVDFLHDVWPAFSTLLRCTVCNWQTAEMSKFIKHYETQHLETSGAWGSVAHEVACARVETVRDTFDRAND